MRFKRIICLMLTVIMAVSAVAVSAQAATKMPDLLIGDADGDGKISVMDSTAIALHLAEIKPLDEMSVQVAKTDFDNDELTILDATIIQRKLANFDDNVTREVGLPAFKYVSGEYKPALDEYKRVFDIYMTRNKISGVAFATRNGRVMYQAAQGMQDTANNVPMSMDTLFPIGSVSKQFCATAVMMLKDQGKLDVNETIDKYFPDYKYAQQITIHNLLCMRSGIYDYVNENENQNYIYDNEADNQREALDFIYSQELKFEPGSKYAYSNSNFFLLSLIVEQVSGIDYHEFVQTNIFDKLSMDNTGFYEELLYSDTTAEFIIPGYPEGLPYPAGLAQGAGDIVSNAKDIDKWLTAMGKGVLLSEESYELMTTDHCEGDSIYGYGINVEKGKKLSHGGNFLTYESFVLTYANENLNVFVVTNDGWNSTVRMESFAQMIAAKIRT